MINSDLDAVPSTTRDLEGLLDDAVSAPLSAGGFLLVLAGEHPGRVFPLNRGEYLIGRSQEAEIRIDQASVSHRHAKVVLTGEHHLVVDLGSTNGTYLNDERVDDGVLRGGDVIRVGETIMSFLLPRGDAGELPTIAIAHVPVDMIASGRSGARSLRNGLRSNRGIQVRNADEGMSLRDIVGNAVRATRFVSRYHRLIATCAAFSAAVGVGSVLIRPPPGVASFEMRLTPKPSENATAQSDENAQYFAAAEMDWRSPELVRRTLTVLDSRPPTNEEVAAARERLKLDGIALATYHGVYSDKTPGRALGFLDQHVKGYVDFEVEKALRVISAQVGFLKGQLSENEGELSRTESQLRDFKQNHLDGLPDQAREQFTARMALKARQTALAGEVERSALALDAERHKITNDDPLFAHKVESTVPYESAIVDVKRKLGEARAAGLGAEHPEVQRLERQATELERLSSQTVNADATDVERRADPALRAMNDRVADLEVSRNAAAKELARVNGDLAEVDKVMKALPEVEAKYAELTRSYAATKQLHDKLFERYKANELELELEKAVAAARYQVTSTPELARRSLRATMFTRSAIGAVVGLLFSMMIIAVMELRRYLSENEF